MKISSFKKQAKQELKKARTNDPETWKRFGSKVDPNVSPDTVKLGHVQDVLAREQGFQDWKHMIRAHQAVANQDEGYARDQVLTLYRKTRCIEKVSRQLSLPEALVREIVTLSID
jgi:hypothetical protein